MQSSPLMLAVEPDAVLPEGEQKGAASVREDRRVAPRIAAELHVEFESFDEFVSAYTLDVSCTGLFIPTDKLMPAGAVVALNLELPEGGPKIRAVARVAYALDVDRARHMGRVPGVGMEVSRRGWPPVRRADCKLPG